LYKWFPVPLVLLVLFVSAIKGINFQQGPDELRFLINTGTSTTTFPVVIVFVLNAFVFVPLGDLVGSYFKKIPPLQAYSWDLGGAIAGTVLFGLFSYFWSRMVPSFLGGADATFGGGTVLCLHHCNVIVRGPNCGIIHPFYHHTQACCEKKACYN